MKLLTNRQWALHLDEVKVLRGELTEAKSLKKVLELLVSQEKTSITASSGITINCVDGSYGLSLGDSVLVYVDDILGGKVIKQEGTKCIVIDKSGTVKTGLTKQKADPKFIYKLVRE